MRNFTFIHTHSHRLRHAPVFTPLPIHNRDSSILLFTQDLFPELDVACANADPEEAQRAANGADAAEACTYCCQILLAFLSNLVRHLYKTLIYRVWGTMIRP